MFSFPDFGQLEKVYYADPQAEIQIDELINLIENKRNSLNRYYNLNEQLYNGIVSDEYFKENENVLNNSKLYANYAKYITDTLTGYFMGKGVSVSSKDESVQEILKNLNDDNDTNNEIAKMTALYGHAFDYTFVDANNELQTTFIHPREIIMIYSNEIDQSPLAACHFYFPANWNGETYLKGKLYTNSEVVTFVKKGKDLTVDEPMLNPFGRIPINEYIENEERLGAFDAVKSLIAAYSNTLTQKANDVAYFADALLLLLGVNIENVDHEMMKHRRIFNIENYDKEMPPIVNFLERPTNDGTQEHLLNRLTEDIHVIANVPKLTDEKFGAASGIAMQYKLWGLETIRSTKERKFRYALRQRFEVYASYLNVVRNSSFDTSKLEFTFYSNRPNDVKEQVEIVTSLAGVISHQTQLEQLEMIANTEEELARIAEEGNQMMGDQYGKI